MMKNLLSIFQSLRLIIVSLFLLVYFAARRVWRARRYILTGKKPERQKEVLFTDRRGQIYMPINKGGTLRAMKPVGGVKLEPRRKRDKRMKKTAA